MRADIDVDRHRGDHADEAPTVGAAAGFHDQHDEQGADDQAAQRDQCRFVGKRRIAGGDVAAQSDETAPRRPSRSSARRRDVSAMYASASVRPRQIGQQLFGIEGYVEDLARNVEHPQHRPTATSSDWKTLVQKTVAFDAAEANSAASGMIRSSLTEEPWPGCCGP